jgi:TonB family protein
MRLILAPLLFLLTISVLPQAAPEEYRMESVVETSTGARLPAVSFSIEKDGKPFQRNGHSVGAASDLNGVFSLSLPAGNYKMTAAGIPESRFRLFLSIAENGPKPDRLIVPMEEDVFCPIEERPNPSPTKIVTPVYPHTARAVRALGTVTVVIEIRSDGTVSSAKAISGHPLLRSSSVQAARGFLFEPSDQELRTLTIPFVFTDWAEEKKDLKRAACPNRILVATPPEVIDTTEN